MNVAVTAWKDELASIVESDAAPRPDAPAIQSVMPEAVVTPRTSQEVAAVLAFANERDLVVAPVGGMTKSEMGNPPEKLDILLRTARLVGVSHYDPGDLTIGVGAGMTMARLEVILAENNQFLPLDVRAADRATIGGVLAANASGPMRSAYGGARDVCIGVEFATADGRVAHGGGRVVKNVAGFDLMKLFIGSHGTLGVLTAVHLKVFPRPKQMRTFISRFADADAAAAFRDRVVRSPLGNTAMCLEAVSPRALEYLTRHEARDPDHYAPSGAVHQVNHWEVWVRAAGSDAVLARVRRELGAEVAEECGGTEESERWARMREFEDTVRERHRNAMVLHVTAPPSEAARAFSAAEVTASEHNLLCAAVGRIAAGFLVVAMMPLAVDPPSAMQFANAVSALRGRLPAEACAVVAACPLEAKSRFDVWGASPTDFSAMRAVRDAMDPKRILNRGRFLV